MRVRLTAKLGEFFDDGYALLCAISGHGTDGIEHTLSFDRISEAAAAEDPLDDDGIHTEFDDQINGAFNKTRQCRLTRTLLSVDLSGQLGKLVGVEGFDIDLDMDDATYETLRIGLSRVLRGTPGVLILADPTL